MQPVLANTVPFGAGPDLLLTLACVYAFRIGGAAGVAIGFGAGVLHGSMVGKCIGSFCASRTAAAWVGVWSARYLPRESLLSAAVVCCGATWVAEGAFLILSPRFGFLRWGGAVALSSLMNAAAAIPVAYVIGVLDRALRRGRRRRLGAMRAH